MANECSFFCPGCPAEHVAQNFNRHQELDPTASGVIFYGALLSRGRGGIIGEAIEQGATTHEEVLEQVNQTIWGQRPDELHGDLTEASIIEAAIECKLREVRGECTLEQHMENLHSISTE